MGFKNHIIFEVGKKINYQKEILTALPKLSGSI